MPIEFDVPRNGYFFTRSVPHFPRVPLTEKGIVGLFVAQKTIAQYQGTSLQPVLDSAFRKMCASAPYAQVGGMSFFFQIVPKSLQSIFTGLVFSSD